MVQTAKKTALKNQERRFSCQIENCPIDLHRWYHLKFTSTILHWMYPSLQEKLPFSNKKRAKIYLFLAKRNRIHSASQWRRFFLMTPHPICHTMALLKYSYLIRPKNAFHYTAQSCYFPIFCLVKSKPYENIFFKPYLDNFWKQNLCFFID